MPRAKNDVIARMDCPVEGCTEQIAVLQNVRGYLYTKCPSCGCDQRNGAVAQTLFWEQARVVEGVDPASIQRPRNLPADIGPIGCGTGYVPAPVPYPKPANPEPARVPVDDRDSAPVPDKKPVHEPIGPKGVIGSVLFVLGVLGFVAVGAVAARG